MKLFLCVTIAAACLWPSPALADELFGGLYIHDVESPLTLGGVEKGVDFQLGYRFGQIGRTPLQPYVFGALNSAGETHYAAAGMSAKLGKRLFIRPAIGLGLHTGDDRDFDDPFDDDVEFGSRLLFVPEVAVGFQVDEKFSVEASLVHLSHGQLFGDQNPGIDNVGVRLNWKL